jgi:hypothetical protein
MVNKLLEGQISYMFPFSTYPFPHLEIFKIHSQKSHKKGEKKKKDFCLLSQNLNTNQPWLTQHKLSQKEPKPINANPKF